MSFWTVYDMIFLLAGCYGLSICAKVRMTGELEDMRLLLPRKIKLDRCLDPAGYLGRVLPWMAGFSATVVLNGAVGMAEDMRLGLPHAVHMVTLGLCLAAAAAFFAVQRKAVEEFWDLEEDDQDADDE